ncbi:MAG TPA: hypothetical protein VJQ57_13955 [Acidimicrobiia bacterium]|nr:hypothetical protein [Acidimicrobiia bacterium]
MELFTVIAITTWSTFVILYGASQIGKTPKPITSGGAVATLVIYSAIIFGVIYLAGN